MPALLKPRAKAVHPVFFEGFWKTPAFRRVVVNKLEEFIQKSGVSLRKSSVEMEAIVFIRARTQDDYLSIMAKLVAHFRDIYFKNTGQTRDGANAQEVQGLPNAPAGGQLNNEGVQANPMINQRRLQVPPNQNMSVFNRRRTAINAHAQGQMQAPPYTIGMPPNRNILLINQIRAANNAQGRMQVPPNQNIPVIDQRGAANNANAQGQMQAPPYTTGMPPNRAGGIQDQIVPQNAIYRQWQ